jgi:hypothetical protein
LSLPQAKHRFFFTGFDLLPCPPAGALLAIDEEFYPTG